jgi:small subunit ribosomal protein S6
MFDYPIKLPTFAPSFVKLITKMALKHYETVFILTPVLPENQAKDAVEKFKEVIKSQTDADLYHEENWGIRKLAYPIQHKSTGYYTLFEFKGNPDIVAALETAFRRDERVLRFMTISLDKYALEYNEKRRRGAFNKKGNNAGASAEKPEKLETVA